MSLAELKKLELHRWYSNMQQNCQIGKIKANVAKFWPV